MTTNAEVLKQIEHVDDDTEINVVLTNHTVRMKAGTFREMLKEFPLEIYGDM